MVVVGGEVMMLRYKRLCTFPLRDFISCPEPTDDFNGLLRRCSFRETELISVNKTDTGIFHLHKERLYCSNSMLTTNAIEVA